MKIWTDKEIKFLKDNYPSKGTNYCADVLNRSKQSINIKASRLNLKVTKSAAGRPRSTHDCYEQTLMTKEIDYYPLEPYITAHTKIKHSCYSGHVWEVEPANILSGFGCPQCAYHGFDLDKPAILYYIKIGDYYKIGITNRSVLDRFSQDKNKPIKILFEKLYATGKEAKEEEQLILNSHPRISVPGYLAKGGNTELFLTDVLQFEAQK